VTVAMLRLFALVGIRERLSDSYSTMSSEESSHNPFLLIVLNWINVKLQMFEAHL